MQRADLDNIIDQKIRARLKSGLGDNERELAAKLSQSIKSKVELDRIAEGLKSSNDNAQRKNERRSYRVRVVKKAMYDTVEALIRASRKKQSEERIVKAVQKRLSEWCRKHVNHLKV